MSDDCFIVKFKSGEQNFIYKYGINTGYTQISNKVLRCLFLSDRAKQLYTNIISYAFGEKRDCYPKQITLRTELGWCKDTLNNYTNELRTSRLIETESQGVGKPLIYHIQELHKVPLLVHSEIVYSLKYLSSDGEAFYSAVEEYKKSDLFYKVNESENPEDFKEKIEGWFQNYFNKKLKKKMRTRRSNEQQEENFYELNQKSKRKGKSYLDLDVQDWNAVHFCSYFSDQYLIKMKSVYILTKVDYGIMKRLIETKENKEMIKEYIDNFLDLDFFTVKTIKGFASSYVQTVLDYYNKTGHLPFKKKQQTVEINDDWASDLKGYFD